MRLLPEHVARRLEPVPGRARSRPVRNGVITLLVAAAATMIALTGLPFVGEGGSTVRAELAGSNVLEAGDPVRVGGVDVGEVESVALTPSRTSMVTMRVGGGVVVKRDAEARAYWRTLLGGSFYIDLDVGSPSAPELGDGVIPLGRTGDQVEFDDFFQPFDGPTRRNQQTIYRELRRAFEDPDAVGRLLDTLPTLTTVDRGLEPLRGQEADDLRRLVASTGRFTNALGKSPERLSALVADADTTLGITSRRREQLGRTIEVSPATLKATLAGMRHTIRSLPRLDALVSDLRPAARALAPSAAASAPALHEADAFLRESRPLLRSVGPLFEDLDRAGRAGAPLIGELSPTLDRLNQTLIPWLKKKDPDTDRATYQMIGPALSLIDGMSSEFDDVGYWLRFPAQGDERSVGNSPCQPFLTDPSQDEELRCGALSSVLPGLPRGAPRP